MDTQSSQPTLSEVVRQEYTKRYLFLVFSTACALQMFEERVAIMLQGSLLHARILSYTEANTDYAKIVGFALVLYVPLVMVIMKCCKPYLYLRTVSVLTLATLLIDMALINVLSFKQISKGLYLIFMSGCEKALLTALMLCLYVFGLRLVALPFRPYLLQLYFASMNCGSLVGSLLGSSLTLLQIQEQLSLVFT